MQVTLRILAIRNHLWKPPSLNILQSEVVGGALVFYINGIALNYHAVSLKRFNRLCPNYLLYWTMLERAIERGCTAFDMGRSLLDSTQLAFKQNWNPATVPLCYSYQLRKLQEIPFLDPRNTTYAMGVALWRHLPVRLTAALGPKLIRGIA